MREELSIGCTPAAEDCIQVHRDSDYMPAMKAECRRFRDLLARAYPECRFVIRNNPHDFGAYLDVEAVYDDQDEAAMTAAFEVEATCPQTWLELEAMAERVDSALPNPVGR